MTNPRFIQNLSSDTFEEFENKHLRPSGFLIAPNRATGKLRKLANKVVANGLYFFVDNGNFVEIGKIRKEFRAEAKVLRNRVKAFEEKIGRSCRAGELSTGLISDYDNLAKRVRKLARTRVVPDPASINKQLALSPDALIGAEDLTMACWLSLDIESRYTSFKRRDYRRYNNAVVKRAVQAQDHLGPKLFKYYYPVASAVSYNTAVDAGREFASHGIKSISMGFGAFMADSNYVDHMKMGRRRINFGANLPARYMRTVAVALGFWTGYREVAGRPPERFHFLGLGAPIMIPLVTLAASSTIQLTFDATSPIKDAVRGGTLYVEDPAPLKIRTRKVAYRLATDPNHQWNCPCPFCVAFVVKHPFKYDIGYRWLRQESKSKVTKKDLQPSGALYKAYPLLSEPKAGNLRKLVNYSRIGHNHWVIDRIISSVRRAARDKRLHTRVSNIVDGYRTNTSPPFAEALKISLQLITDNKPVD